MTTFRYPAVMACPRPRHMRNGHTYMPRKYAAYKHGVASAYRDAGGGLVAGPVRVSIDVMRALPKSAPKSVGAEEDMHKPDVDNVAKGVMDALNGVAYEDDRQVVSLSVLKMPRMRREHDEIRVRVESFDDKE